MVYDLSPTRISFINAPKHCIPFLRKNDPNSSLTVSQNIFFQPYIYIFSQLSQVCIQICEIDIVNLNIGLCIPPLGTGIGQLFPISIFLLGAQIDNFSQLPLHLTVACG